MSSHYRDEMLKIVDEYQQEHDCESFEIRDVASWALLTNRFELQPEDQLRLACERFRSILATETHVTPSGGAMRTYHSVKAQVDDTQRYLWADVRRNGNRNFIMTSLTERWRQARNDVESIKNDLRQWNAHYRRPDEAPIQLDFDFNQDDDLQSAG